MDAQYRYFLQRLSALTPLMLAVSLAAVSQTALPGDPTRDGRTDILDVQAGISQALGAAEGSAEADVDENAMIDVLDVQHMINTALGLAGLVQRVTGVVDCACNLDDLRLVAISPSGLRRMTEIDDDTGEFEITLRTRASWAFLVCGTTTVDNTTTPRCVGWFVFPLGDRFVSTLPLPVLSRGEILDLGTVTRVQDRFFIESDIRELLTLLGQPIDRVDRNTNGVPDFIELLLRRVNTAPDFPDNTDVEALMEVVAACVDEQDRNLTVSLVDRDDNRIPDFLQPWLKCLREALAAVLSVELKGETGTQQLAAIMAHVVGEIPDWLAQLQRFQLADANDNGIPDRMEDGLAGEGFDNPIDRNSNGIPDFAEDADGDGVSNIDDEDWRNRTDVADGDGDGIPDDEDWDDDNDGVPDYADTDAPDGSRDGTTAR